MKEFFKVKMPKEVFQEIERFHPVGEEVLPLQAALGRVLADAVIAKESLPSFPRATMDGYALRARDTFGSSEGQPALLRIIGEVAMGEETSLKVGPGEAVRIATGGMLPEGADAVVMVEFTEEIDDRTVEIYKSVAPATHIVQAGEDVERGTRILEKGHRLRPQDLGILAGLGISRVRTFRRPLVAHVSTGDELVEIENTPSGGQIRDINRYCLHGSILEAGGIPDFLGISKDRYEALLEFSQKGIERADCLLICGGSSVGTRDMTLRVLQAIEGVEVLVHGISISPGKPTIIARWGEKAIVGLPGHPVSAMIVFRVFVYPLIGMLGGMGLETVGERRSVPARISRNLASAQGREDYIRVRLERREEGLWAHPVLGTSGVLSTMVKADGLVAIGIYSEGVEKGERVEVLLF